MELVAELRGCDGRTRAVRVPCPARGAEGEQLSAVRGALAELQQRVVELLAPLVQEEREAAGDGGGRTRGALGEEDGEEEEGVGDEDEEEDGGGLSAEDPPPKRTKVQQP